MTTILLTGVSGAGKTTIAKALADDLLLQSRSSGSEMDQGVFGVISLRKTNEIGERNGIRAWLCPSDTVLDLAVLAEQEGDVARAQDDSLSFDLQGGGEADEPGEPGDGGWREKQTTRANTETPQTQGEQVRIGPWRFFQSAFDSVNEHLCREAVASRSQPGVVALVDEIGPLELRRGDGFIKGFEAVVDTEASLVAVIRPTLVDELSAWISVRSPTRGDGGFHVVRVTEDSKTAPTVDAILGMLERS
jgi:nucleoside-triphosphatase THEP1